MTRFTKEYAQEYAKGILLNIQREIAKEALRCLTPANINETHEYCTGLKKTRDLIQDELDKLEIEQA